MVNLRESTSTQPDKGVGGDGGVWESIILVNSTTRGDTGPLLDPVTTSNLTHLYTCYADEGCAGDPAIMLQLAPLSASTQFFNPGWRVPSGRVFDAVRDFNASQHFESSAQLQACIDAAAGASNDAICYIPSGTYVVNRTLTVCGSDWTLMGGGSGFLAQIEWQSTPNSTAQATLAMGPGAGCSASNVTIQRITLTRSSPGGVDFALSRPSALPASLIGQEPRQRHSTVSLPGGGNQNPRINALLDNFYFQSSGAVFNGLEAGDVARGPMWNGDAEVWDSDAAVVLPSFFGSGTNGLTVARTQAAPPLPDRTAGILGAGAFVSACSLYDIRLYNSSSLTLGSYYTETSRSNLYAEGDSTSPPGVLAVDQSKLNSGWVNGSVPMPSWLIRNYSGAITYLGNTGSTAWLVDVDASDLDVGLWGIALNDNNTVLAVEGGAVLHLQGNIIAPYEPAPPYSEQGWLQDAVHASTPMVLQRGLDALRKLGIMDLRYNLPWTAF